MKRRNTATGSRKNTVGKASGAALAGKQTFMDLHQPAVQSIRDVVKAEYMLKEGGSYKSWKTRYFVLDGTARTLYYYSKPKDKKPLGFIPLWDVKVEPNVDRDYQNCFEISHPDRRKFYLITQTPKELNEWVDTLRRVVSEGAKQQRLKVNSFWQRSFGAEDHVEWSRFNAALKDFLNDQYSVSVEDQLHFVLATFALKRQPKNELHLGQLHLFNELFGSLPKVYNKLGSVCTWFYGALTSADAERRLEGQPEGTFLLRMRRFAADSGLLALSVVSKKSVLHTNIFKEPITDMYYTAYNEPVYSSVQELVSDHPLCEKPLVSTPSVAEEYYAQFEEARSSPDTPSAPEDALETTPPESPRGQSTVLQPETPVVSRRAPAHTPDTEDEEEEEEEEEDNDEEGQEKEPEERQPVPVAAAKARPGEGPIVSNFENGVSTFVSMHRPRVDEVRDVLKTGWLQTDAAHEGQWERRFFKLSGELKMVYFFEAASDCVAVGHVPLWGCHIEETEEGEEGSFQISHPDRNTVCLRARDETEMNDWANALLTVIDEWQEEQTRKRERFWRLHFGDVKEVPWPSFVEALKQDLGPGKLDRRREEHLRFMIGTFAAKNQSLNLLKSRQLFLFIELFGPLEVCYAQMEKVHLWYQGSLTSSDAKSRLVDCEEGTFLVRLRRFAADSGLLALSFLQNGKVEHVNIFKDPLSECYYLTEEEPVHVDLESLLGDQREEQHLRALPEGALGRAYREYRAKFDKLDAETGVPLYVEVDEKETAKQLEEEQQRQRMEEQRLRALEEAEQQQLRDAEELRLRKQQEAARAAAAAADAEEAARAKADAEAEAARAEAEAAKANADAEAEAEAAQVKAEAEAAQAKAEAEAAHAKAEAEAAQAKADAQAARVQAETEAARVNTEVEAAIAAASTPEEVALAEERRLVAEKKRLAAELEAKRKALADERARLEASVAKSAVAKKSLLVDTPTRRSGIVSASIDRAKLILEYLDVLEENGSLTEEEVYSVESLVTGKDQLVLMYYETYHGDDATFCKKIRRHLRAQAAKKG